MSYGYSAELLLGDLKISFGGPSDLRMSFDVKRDKSRDPNDATIRIWNLAPATRAKLESTPRVFADLKAGYRDSGVFGIFSGVLLGVESSRDDGGFVTEITLGDDAKARAALNRVHRVFPAGTAVEAVFRELIKATGLQPGNFSQAAAELRIQGHATLPRAWSAAGSALNELQIFARSAGIQYTIQDQQVLLLGVKSSALGAPLLRGENVLGIPTTDAEGIVSCTSRLIPDLIPGLAFRLETEEVKGDYAAISSRHYGDTHGNDWNIDVQGMPFALLKTKGLKINE
jgi:hypothetical protein